MGLFDSIRNVFFNREQQRKQQEQTHLRRRFLRFADCRAVGFLLDASNEQTRLALMLLARELAAAGKSVSVLLYVDAKEVPADVKSEAERRLAGCEMLFVCHKDLSWSRLPQGEAIERFIQQTYDWLLVPKLAAHQQLDYLAAASPAHARISCYTGAEQDLAAYDFFAALPQPAQDIQAYLHALRLLLGIPTEGA